MTNLPKIDSLKLRTEKIPLSDTSYFSSTFLDYLDQNPKLKDFVSTYPTPQAFEELIENRHFPAENRTSLVKVLNEQYAELALSGKLIQNIAALKNENCFTITTGHQLNIFTGPLFFIYKIISTIKACQILKEQYPQSDFVPIYWMASEDHDFAEINHFNLFGKEYRWESHQRGAVGRFNLEGITEVLEQLKDCPKLFEEAYREGKNLAEATRNIVNQLFWDYGLVVIDADHRDLKKIFTPVIRDEIINQNTFQRVVKSTEALQAKGYKTLVTPREINLFYLKQGLRERIVKKGKRYEILGNDLSFSQQELLEELKNYPERFSPNVVLRTLYQETILPNLAYIGGPGELSYWLQFKSIFDYYQLPFPVLFPRNNVLYVTKPNAKKKAKLGLSIEDIFLDPNTLKATFVERNSGTALNLNSEKASIKATYEEITDKIKAIDRSLTGYIKAEENKALKNLDHIEKRLKKAEERNQEMTVTQVMGLKEKLFPNGSLQERHQNFLNFYINNPGFIDELMDHLDPFDLSFHILLEDG
jgi:bacillithiol biosynthesis cysteine-adding enzyme BshC